MRRTLSLLIALLGLATLTFYALACVEEIEGNNYADYADFIGAVPGIVCGVGTIGEAGDIDVWKFEITQPVLIRIETSAFLYEGDTMIGLYDENLRLVGSDDDSGEDYFSLIDFEATGQILDPGYYYVAVWDADPAFSSRQPYQVTVTGYVPESKPESTPPDSWDCDMSEYRTFSLGFTMHLNTNRGSDNYFSDSIWNAGSGEPPLEWSGGSFSAAFTKTEPGGSGVISSISETITTVSVSGFVSTDCRTLLTVTAFKKVETREGGELAWVRTLEITLVNLPLDQAGVLVPRCTLEGQEIAAHVTQLTYGTDYGGTLSPWNYWVESFSLHSTDTMQIAFSRRTP